MRLASAPGPADDLDELLADERQDPRQRLERGSCGGLRADSARRSASAALRVSALARSTRIAKTSSNVGRVSWAATTSPPAARRPHRRRPAGGRGVLDGRPWTAGTVLADRDDAGHRSMVGESNGAGLDVDDVAAERVAPELVRRASATSRPSAISATWSHSSASPTYWVVTRIVRPASRRRWSSSQTFAAQDRVDAGRRLVEEQQDRARGRARRRARGGAACRPTCRSPGGRGRPTARASSRTSRTRRRRRRQSSPNRLRDEVDVLARGEVRVERELLGHVADPLAGRAPERRWVARRGRGSRRRRARARRSASGPSSSCRSPDGPMTPRIVPAGS